MPVRKASLREIVANDADPGLEITQSGAGVGLSLNKPITLPVGAVGAPSLGFVGDLTTGLYHVGAGQIGMAIAGALKATFSANGLRVGDGTAPTVSLEAASGLDVIAGNLRLRAPAGMLEIGTDDAGNIKMQITGSTIQNYGNAAAGEMYIIANENLHLRTGGSEGILFQADADNPISGFFAKQVTKDFEDDLFDAAGLTDSATIWQQPANTRLIAVIMRLETQFAGPSLTDMRVTMGLAGDNDGLLTTTGNLTSDAEDTEYEDVGAYYAVFTAGLACKTGSAIDWIAYATATGCNMNALTAGSIDFYFLYEDTNF